jgi:dTDP-glucose 4,6-dehydratase
MTMPKRILVTGAAGFLGSHLTDALLAQGHSVVGVDNVSTGNMVNLEHLSQELRFRFVRRDIVHAFDPGPVDYVFNLASPASPVDYARLGVETLLVGSAGTINTLDIAHKYRAGYLHASTSECYGDPQVHPQIESYWGNVNPVGPRSVYDEAKRFSEAAVTAYNRYYGVNTHLVRIFNTYGPRLQANDGRVISNFMMQALRGESLTVYGDGLQTRSFCYVSDLIEGIICLAASDEHAPVNIGNPIEFTMLECAQEVLAVTGSKSAIVHKPLPQDDPARRRPDITKARQLLGWEPKIKLREGLERSLEYFRSCVYSEMSQIPLHAITSDMPSVYSSVKLRKVANNELRANAMERANGTQ